MAATVLSNPHLRAIYDPNCHPRAEPGRLEANNLRDISGGLRTKLHEEQARSFRLEHEIRRLRSELGHALTYPEEMAARR